MYHNNFENQYYPQAEQSFGPPLYQEPQYDPSYESQGNYGHYNQRFEPTYDHGYQHQNSNQSWKNYETQKSNVSYFNGGGYEKENNPYGYENQNHPQNWNKFEKQAPTSTGTPHQGNLYVSNNVGDRIPGTKLGESDSLTIADFADVIQIAKQRNMQCFDAIVNVLDQSASVENNLVASPAHTTLMLRNVPQQYTQAEFFQEMENLGFIPFIDFLYVPPNHRQQTPDHRRQLGNAGLTFINFVNTEACREFQEFFQEGRVLQQFPPKPDKLVSIIPSTTQGWRANVLKVVRNCIVRRKRVHPSELPMLFCRDTRELIPFPVPQEQRAGFARLSEGRLNTPVSLAAELDDFEGESASGASSGDKKSSRGTNETVRSFESQKVMIEHDPNEAFAPSAFGEDAIAQKHEMDYAARRQKAMEQAAQYDLQNASYVAEYQKQTEQQNTNFARQQSNSNFLSRQKSREASKKSNHYDYDGSFNQPIPDFYEMTCHEIPEGHPLKLLKDGKCQKATDFFEKFGIKGETCDKRNRDHVKHIKEMRSKLQICKAQRDKDGLSRYQKARKDRVELQELQLPNSRRTSTNSQLDQILHKMKESKSPSSKAAAAALKSAIMSTALGEKLKAAESKSSVLSDFKNLDVEGFAEKNLSKKMNLSKASESGESDDSFNSKLFAQEETATVVDPLLNKVVCKNLEKMLSSIRGEDLGDTTAEDEEEVVRRSASRLFRRSTSNLISVIA